MILESKEMPEKIDSYWEDISFQVIYSKFFGYKYLAFNSYNFETESAYEFFCWKLSLIPGPILSQPYDSVYETVS